MSSSSSQSWVCYIVSFLPLFDLGGETFADSCGPGAWSPHHLLSGFPFHQQLLLLHISSCISFVKLCFSQVIHITVSGVFLPLAQNTWQKPSLKKGSFIRTDNFIGFSPWSGGTSWRRLRLNKVAHFLLAGYQKASKQLEKRCLSKACLQWTAFFSQSQFLIRPLGCSIIKDPLMRSEFLWFSHIPRAPKLATKTSANWIWETFQI